MRYDPTTQPYDEPFRHVEAEQLRRLPLQYEDGPDYCTVKDAQGRDFALTMQPDLMKAMEKSLSGEAADFVRPPATMPQNVEVAIRRMRTLADSALGSLYEVECQREMRNACVLLENAYRPKVP